MEQTWQDMMCRDLRLIEVIGIAEKIDETSIVCIRHCGVGGLLK
jgi:hypothetical protein